MSQRSPEPCDCPLQPFVGELADPSAGVADDVVMVLTTRDHRLVTGAALTDLDALHQADALKGVERAIHAGGPDPAPAGSERVGDLLRGDTAVLLRELVDDGSPRTAAPVPGLVERGQRHLGP